MKRKTRYLGFGNTAALKHGGCSNGSRTRAYAVWCSMRARCSNPKDRWYRDVNVCRRWDMFENFLADMGDPPTPKHQIDRIKNYRGYSPGNCRWVTPSENALNRRTTRWITFRGETKAMSQWAIDMGINLRTLKSRIDNLGWHLDDALGGKFE